MADFASYFTITIFVGFALFNILAVPVRYGCCQSTIAELVHRCGLKKKLSGAVQELRNSLDSKAAFMEMQGVHVTKTRVFLVITSCEKSKVVPLNEKVYLPQEWLPNSPRGPFEYQLKLSVDVNIDPLVTMKTNGVPGITGPIAFTIDQAAHWENVGSDPATNQYYLQE